MTVMQGIASLRAARYPESAIARAVTPPADIQDIAFWQDMALRLHSQTDLNKAAARLRLSESRLISSLFTP